MWWLWYVSHHQNHRLSPVVHFTINQPIIPKFMAPLNNQNKALSFWWADIKAIYIPIGNPDSTMDKLIVV